MVMQVVRSEELECDSDLSPGLVEDVHQGRQAKLETNYNYIILANSKGLQFKL